MKHDESVRKRYAELESANVSDVLDEMGIRNQGLASSIQGITGQKVAGYAYTINGTMIPYPGTGDPVKMEACAGVSPGEVTVWSGGGEGICYFGELIALGMAESGSVGAVLDGGIRDVTPLREAGFDVFGRYKTAVQSIGRWRVTDWQEPIFMPGATSATVTVNPGDMILGDEDGVIVIPQAHIMEVLTATEEISNKEKLIRKALNEGLGLQDALAKYGHI